MACRHQYSVRLVLANTLELPNPRGELVTVGNRFSNLWPSTNLLLPNCGLVLQRRYTGRNYLITRRLLKNRFLGRSYNHVLFSREGRLPFPRPHMG